MKSVLHPQLNGLVYVTGAYGVGKTTFATTLENPNLIAMIDFDLKFKAEAERLGIWYRSPGGNDNDIYAADQQKMSDWFQMSLKEIPQGRTVVVIDNASPLETILGYVVSRDPKRYGVNPSNAEKGAYGGINPGIGTIWKNITQFLQKRGVRVIVVACHLSSPWMNGQPIPNRFKGKGNKALQELANLSLVLVRGKTYIPSGIIIKEQYAMRQWDDDKGEWIVRRVFPTRFPQATWKAITGYFTAPADFSHPKEGETVSRDELEMFGELYSKQQLDFIKAVANGKFEEEGPQYIPTTEPEQSQPPQQQNSSQQSQPKPQSQVDPMLMECDALSVKANGSFRKAYEADRGKWQVRSLAEWAAYLLKVAALREKMTKVVIDGQTVFAEQPKNLTDFTGVVDILREAYKSGQHDGKTLTVEVFQEEIEQLAYLIATFQGIQIPEMVKLLMDNTQDPVELEQINAIAEDGAKLYALCTAKGLL